MEVTAVILPRRRFGEGIPETFTAEAGRIPAPSAVRQDARGAEPLMLRRFEQGMTDKRSRA